MKKKLLTLALAIITLVSLAACSNSEKGEQTYTIGVASDVERIQWEEAAKELEEDGITLEIVVFNDYIRQNPGVEDNSLDLNAFQHMAYLENWNKENSGSLVPIGFSYISPFGLYSDKIKDYNDLKDGDTIAIPNDVTNGARAIQLLAAIGVIELKEGAPDLPALTDIEVYNKDIIIQPLEGNQIAAALPDVTAACINTNYVIDQLQKTPKDALYVDTDYGDKVNDIYKNIIVVKNSNKDNDDFKKIVKAYQTDKVAALIEKSGDSPAWNLN